MDDVQCMVFFSPTLTLNFPPFLPPSPLFQLFLLSLSQAGAGATAAQSAEAHVAESQRPVPWVPTAPHEGHAEDRERAVIRTAPPGGGDKEERPGLWFVSTGTQ